METDTERQRKGFVADHESGQWSMTELCERYGISRPTGHELLRRAEAEGEVGLRDRSRTPHTCPSQPPAEAPGCRPAREQPPEPGAAGRLQGTVQDNRREVLPSGRIDERTGRITGVEL